MFLCWKSSHTNSHCWTPNVVASQLNPYKLYLPTRHCHSNFVPFNGKANTAAKLSKNLYIKKNILLFHLLHSTRNCWPCCPRTVMLYMLANMPLPSEWLCPSAAVWYTREAERSSLNYFDRLCWDCFSGTAVHGNGSGILALTTQMIGVLI